MPFAGYPDFNACIAAQIKQGHSEESAKKICGAIKAKTEGELSTESTKLSTPENKSDLKTNNLEGVEIFAEGIWNGDTYTVKDLEDIVNNFKSLNGKVEPPLKLGHDDSQSFSGQPAIGYIKDIYRIGKKLFADISDIPQKIYDLIKAKAYKKVSSEILWNYKDGENGNTYDKVLAGVALLGDELPAVNSLDDVKALYKQAARIYNLEVKGGKINMAEEIKKEVPGIEVVKKEIPPEIAAKEKESPIGKDQPVDMADGRPPKDWWDKCVASNEGKVSDTGAYCGYLWHNVVQGSGASPEDVLTQEEFANDYKEIDEKIKEIKGRKAKPKEAPADIQNKLADTEQKLAQAQQELKQFKLKKFEEEDDKFIDEQIKEAKILPAQKEKVKAMLYSLRNLNCPCTTKYSLDGKEVKEDFKDTVKKFIKSLPKLYVLSETSETGTDSTKEYGNIADVAKEIEQGEKLPYRQALKKAHKLVTEGKIKIVTKE